eukprot:Sdes_comp18255_c0_seq1m7879
MASALGKALENLGKLGVAIAVGGGVVQSALYNVEPGHRAIIFDRISGVKPDVVGEGTHFLIPWLHRPIIFDVRTKPRNISTVTGSKDLQNVNITLRILYKPRYSALANIYKNLGVDFDERVLPSIGNEVLKAVVVTTFLLLLHQSQRRILISSHPPLSPLNAGPIRCR